MDIEFTEDTYIKRLSTSQYRLDSRTNVLSGAIYMRGVHKLRRRDPLFLPMYRCGIVLRSYVEKKSPGEREGET